MDIASQLILFATVVDNGGFSAAARTMGQTPSAVGKQITALEDRLGVRLLNRSTRGITLTEEGRTLYTRSHDIAVNVHEAEAAAVSMGKRPQGTLRIAATVAFGKAQVIPILPLFLEQYPDLNVSVELTDRAIDLTTSDHDMAIRFTEQIDQSTVIARKLAPNRRVVCAAPSYIAAHGAPASPTDLANHNCLRISTVDHWNDWHFGDGKGQFTFHARGSFEANSADGVYHAALAGLGIARLSTYLIADDLRSGRLVNLLPSHTETYADIFAIYAERRNLSPKVRLFIDFLVRHFQPIPPWDRQALTPETMAEPVAKSA